MVGAGEHDLRLGLQVASGLQFDLRQMALAVTAVLDQGEVPRGKRPHIHFISDLWREAWCVDCKRPGTLYSMSPELCVQRRGLIPAMQPSQASPSSSIMRNLVVVGFASHYRELRWTYGSTCMCCLIIRDSLLRVENIYNICLGNMGGEYSAACFWLKQQYGDVFLVLREG